MKLVRFLYNETISRGILSEDGVTFNGSDGGSVTVKTDRVKLLAPVVPSKIVSAGLNYRDHAEELGMDIPAEPIIFIKPSTAVIGPGDTVFYPKASARVDFEAELGVVIKDKVRNVSGKEASAHIEGYTCFNDVTARDLQEKDTQWTRAKSFDTFAPVGPWVETDLDPGDLQIRSYLNGELKQDSRTSEFIFDVFELVSFVSGVMTLLPGDIIATGTPSGIGPMKKGDEVIIEIEGIGRLVNHVGEEKAI